MIARLVAMSGVLATACVDAAPIEPAASRPVRTQTALAREAPTNPVPSTPVEAPAERVFGAGVTPSRETTPLRAILTAPERFAGRVVKTTGEVARVCQAMGCWLELRPDRGADEAVRVPMAAHSFFLPRDVEGRPAEIEGAVVLRELSAAQRAHLEAEGARATLSALSIEATGVVVR